MNSARILAVGGLPPYDPRRSIEILAVVALALAVLGGCSKGPCEKLVDLSARCATDKEEMTEDEKQPLIALCQANQETEDLKPEIECALQNDECDGFNKCRKENRTKKAIAEIQQYMDKGDFSRAGIKCSVYEGDSEDVPELVKACTELNKRAVRELTKAAVDVRDGKSDKDYFDICFDLQKFADRLGEARKKEADQLCNEAKTAKDANAAIEKSNENAKSDKNDLPFQCDMAIKDLEALNTDWANVRIKDVANACYVTLGSKVLAAEVPNMSFCKYKVKQIFDGVKKHKLKDPSIDEWITKALAMCEKK